MNSKPVKFGAAVAACCFAVSAPAFAQAPKSDRQAVTAISPIFSQLLRFSMPPGFVVVTENTGGSNYIREAVPNGESADRWTQMITVTGHKDAVSAQFTPQGFANDMADGFKTACPEIFSATSFGPIKLGEQDAFAAVMACGKVNASADGHSEAMLLVAIKGRSDGYTVQWAEHGATRAVAPRIDDSKWKDRLQALMPIRLCAIVPGEAAPYPSCIAQK
jgi:hypothetical protein